MSCKKNKVHEYMTNGNFTSNLIAFCNIVRNFYVISISDISSNRKGFITKYVLHISCNITK